MALSLSGRKILVEATACVAALVVGVVALNQFANHRRAPETAATERDASASVETAAAETIPDKQQHKLRRSTELSAQGDGHFYAEAEINGRAIDVMVDTGASMVALTYDDARRAGVLPSDSAFTGRANTANGVARFAPIVIDRITIGDVEVHSVRGAVMEDRKLDKTLLGMSFLNRLGRIDMSSGKLVLEE